MAGNRRLNDELRRNKLADPLVGFRVPSQNGPVVIDNDQLRPFGQLRLEFNLFEPLQIQGRKNGALALIPTPQNRVHEIDGRLSGDFFDLIRADGKARGVDGTPNIHPASHRYGFLKRQRAAGKVSCGIDDSQVQVVGILSQKIREQGAAHLRISTADLRKLGKADEGAVAPLQSPAPGPRRQAS